jgi:L,D-transpeptidase catalytic domain
MLKNLKMKAIYLLTVFTLFFNCGNSNKDYVFDEIKFYKNVLEIKKFIKKETAYNNHIAFFIDMKINSGKNRFFVYDLKTNKIIDQGLVAHGSGSEIILKDSLKFSNVENSNCTSLGKYSIGNSYSGKFGKAYKLNGLDLTNNNAFARNIVLHKYSIVPYEEQNFKICNSLGCPMVNEKFYNRLEKIIDKSKAKIILNIYY